MKSTRVKRLAECFYSFYPALVVIALYLFCFMHCHMQYYLNDDTNIHSVLSGEYTGSPFAVHQFINVALGFFISRLYILMPSVPWWYVYSQALMLSGILMINYNISICAKKSKTTYVVPAIVIFLFDFVVLLFPFANISYTIVPAVLGSGILAMVMTEESTPKGYKWIILPAFLFMLVVFHRSITKTNDLEFVGRTQLRS